MHSSLPSPPPAAAPSFASYAPLQSLMSSSGSASASAARRRREAMITPAADRAVEGALQGGLTGGVWGSFVALQARARRPEPAAVRQVARIAGGYTLAIGGLLGLFNGASCVSQQLRTGGAAGVVGRGWAPTAGSDHWIDSVVGGFVAGFVVSAPLNLAAPALTGAAAAHAAQAHAAMHMNGSMSYAGFGSMHSAHGHAHGHAAPSTLQWLSCGLEGSGLVQQLARVQWRACTHYGLALGALGALTHLLAERNDNVKVSLTPMPRHTTGRSGPGPASDQPRVGRSD